MGLRRFNSFNIAPGFIGKCFLIRSEIFSSGIFAVPKQSTFIPVGSATPIA
jgi:hypothetical protein